ncbi:MAG: hypothetical protein U0R18_16725 [Mycobacterium sp.]
MTDAVDPYRAEIEQILIGHPRTRYAKVLDGMNRGLTDAEMSVEADAANQPCSAESIAAVRKIVNTTLDGQLVSAPSDADGQSGLYRELLNYPRSPGLDQHIRTRLVQLQELDPAVKLTPLGDVRLGRNDSPRTETEQPMCPQCFMVHAGECL